MVYVLLPATLLFYYPWPISVWKNWTLQVEDVWIEIRSAFFALSQISLDNLRRFLLLLSLVLFSHFFFAFLICSTTVIPSFSWHCSNIPSLPPFLFDFSFLNTFTSPFFSLFLLLFTVVRSFVHFLFFLLHICFTSVHGCSHVFRLGKKPPNSELPSLARETRRKAPGGRSAGPCSMPTAAVSVAVLPQAPPEIQK